MNIALHGGRLAGDARPAKVEPSPVGAELELHRDTGPARRRLMPKIRIRSAPRRSSAPAAGAAGNHFADGGDEGASPIVSCGSR